MQKLVVKLWLEGAWAPEGKPVPFFLVEVPHADFAAFAEACSADDFIQGVHLHTRWHTENRGSRLIQDRTPIAFRGSAVRRLEPSVYHLVEA